MSSKTKNYRDKVEQLENLLGEHQSKVQSKQKCLPTMMIAGAITPVILFLLFFFIKPSFVQVKEGNKFVRSGKKVFMYTIVLTLVTWLGMYLFTYCRGYNRASMLCAR